MFRLLLGNYNFFSLDYQQEKELIEKAKSNPKYFEEIYNIHFPPVFLFIFKRVADKEAASDLTSQVFLNALTHLSRFQHKGVPFSSWLFKIAHNEVMYYYRKTARQRSVIVTDEIIDNFIEETSLNLEELYLRLSAALQSLKLEAMQLIELRFFEKRSFKEIGEILELTENNAKVRTYRVLDQLRKTMGDGKV